MNKEEAAIMESILPPCSPPINLIDPINHSNHTFTPLPHRRLNCVMVGVLGCCCILLLSPFTPIMPFPLLRSEYSIMRSIFSRGRSRILGRRLVVLTLSALRADDKPEEAEVEVEGWDVWEPEEALVRLLVLALVEADVERSIGTAASIPPVPTEVTVSRLALILFSLLSLRARYASASLATSSSRDVVKPSFSASSRIRMVSRSSFRGSVMKERSGVRDGKDGFGQGFGVGVGVVRVKNVKREGGGGAGGLVKRPILRVWLWL